MFNNLEIIHVLLDLFTFRTLKKFHRRINALFFFSITVQWSACWLHFLNWKCCNLFCNSWITEISMTYQLQITIVLHGLFLLKKLIKLRWFRFFYFGWTVLLLFSNVHNYGFIFDFFKAWCLVIRFIFISFQMFRFPFHQNNFELWSTLNSCIHGKFLELFQLQESNCIRFCFSKKVYRKIIRICF